MHVNKILRTEKYRKHLSPPRRNRGEMFRKNKSFESSLVHGKTGKNAHTEEGRHMARKGMRS